MQITDDNFHIFIFGGSGGEPPQNGYAKILVIKSKTETETIDLPLNDYNNPNQNLISQFNDGQDSGRDCSVYYCPAVRATNKDGLGKGIENIAGGWAIGADFDFHGGENVELPPADCLPMGHLPPPSAIVSTGRGYHLYWRSDKYLTAGELNMYINRLNRELTAVNAYEQLPETAQWDESVTGANHNLRYPGTWNPKANKPCTVIEGDNEKTYDFETILPLFYNNRPEHLDAQKKERLLAGLTETERKPGKKKAKTAKAGNATIDLDPIATNPDSDTLADLLAAARQDEINPKAFDNPEHYHVNAKRAYYYLLTLPMVESGRNNALQRVAALLRNDYALGDHAAWFLYQTYNQIKLACPITPDNAGEDEDEWGKLKMAFENGMKYAKGEFGCKVRPIESKENDMTDEDIDYVPEPAQEPSLYDVLAGNAKLAPAPSDYRKTAWWNSLDPKLQQMYETAPAIFDKLIADCPPLLKSTISFFLRCSRKRQPSFALGNALGALGVIFGHVAKHGNVHPNLYTVSVGETSSGKTEMLKPVAKLFGFLGMAGSMTWGGAESGASCWDDVTRNRNQYCYLLDELGDDFVEKARSKTGTCGVFGQYMKMFYLSGMENAGQGKSSKAQKAQHKGGKVPDAHYPFLAILGTSTSGQMLPLWRDQSKLEAGFLPRFCLFPQYPQNETNTKNDDYEIPQEIATTLGAWQTLKNEMWQMDESGEWKPTGNKSGKEFPGLFNVPFSPAGEQEYNRTIANIEAHTAETKDARARALNGKADELITKFALIRACCRVEVVKVQKGGDLIAKKIHNLTIEPEDIAWAAKLTGATLGVSLALMDVEGAGDDANKTPRQIAADVLTKVLRTAKEKGLKWNEIQNSRDYRKPRLKSDIWKDVLREMVHDTHEIACMTLPDGKLKYYWHEFRPKA